MNDSMGRRSLLKKSMLFAMGLPVNHYAFAQDEDPFPPMKIEHTDNVAYSPLLYLGRVKEAIQPKMRFSGASVSDAREWREKGRRTLWDILGESHEPSIDNHNARLVEPAVKLDGYTREKWVLTVTPGRDMPFYVLKPANMRPPYNVALCLHGHGNGVRDIIGMPVDDEAQELIQVLAEDYAVQTVRQGWCAVAPELWSFGERLDNVEGARPGFDGGCEKPHLNAIQLGKCSIGIRAKDIAVLIDWISTRDELDMNSLACMGLSGGGMMTMYISALDERIKKALIAGYLSEMKDSILGIRHCGCNYVPHLAGYFDFPDIASLIAPRPLMAVSGKRDAIFPVGSFRNAAARLRKMYRLLNVEESFMEVEHSGFHSFSPSALTSFLE